MAARAPLGYLTVGWVLLVVLALFPFLSVAADLILLLVQLPRFFGRIARTRSGSEG
jgi:hypothetical protein